MVVSSMSVRSPARSCVSPIPSETLCSRVPNGRHPGAVSTRKAGRVRTTSSADDSAARQGGLPVGSVALVSILCPDRVGVVAAIADYLFDAGVNLRDTSFVTLGTGAEFTSICELPDQVTPESIEQGLLSCLEARGRTSARIALQLRSQPHARRACDAPDHHQRRRSAGPRDSPRCFVNTMPTSSASRRASSPTRRAALRHPLCGFAETRAGECLPGHGNEHGGHAHLHAMERSDSRLPVKAEVLKRASCGSASDGATPWNGHPSRVGFRAEA